MMAGCVIGSSLPHRTDKAKLEWLNRFDRGEVECQEVCHSSWW
jgi:hypothetical protein